MYDTHSETFHEQMGYLKLLSQIYPNQQAAFTEIINLQAILNLPKGTEHFMSDLHGEYQAFFHILNNCSGVIREKVEVLFEDVLSKAEQDDLCTLIYYPRQKLERIIMEHKDSPAWYKTTLHHLIELAKWLSSKYTRSKVRKALPSEFSYIIDELLHAQPGEDNNRAVYHAKILDSIIDTKSQLEFIEALASLIKRLAVDHLHIVGDIFDRGEHADKIMDNLMAYHSLDIVWGNHDILWMGAACGSEACIANVLYNNIKYNNFSILENGYGISLRSLISFANKTYKEGDALSPIIKAIAVILFKLEGQVILRNSEFDMQDRLLLDKIDPKNWTVTIEGKEYPLKTNDFKTVDFRHPYTLTEEEQAVVDDLKLDFCNSEKLQQHIAFLYEKGSLYLCYNQNLLFHGCIPLDEFGSFEGVSVQGEVYQGKKYLDCADQIARRAYRERERKDLDFMWFLWCCNRSPLCGRIVKTFERLYIGDKELIKEPNNHYYTFCVKEHICSMILHEFGVYSERSHIINGHTPVKVKVGESPIKADGKLLVIDGGFCKAYQKSTGIAGYTLIFNSHGMRIKEHKPFLSVEKALDENADIKSSTDTFETISKRIMVGDADNGKDIKELIGQLQSLLEAYRSGALQEKTQ